MQVKNFLKTLGALLFIGSFHLAIAGSIREWEFDSNESANPMHRGLEEEPIIESQDLIEDVSRKENVSRQATQRNHKATAQHKNLAKKPIPETRIQDIKDETAITGKNAKKRPSLFLQPKVERPLLMGDIHHIMHPADSVTFK